MADEAGIELECGAHEGTHVRNEVLWDTYAAQEDLWDLPFRTINGSDANTRRKIMSHHFETLYPAKIVVFESAFTNHRICEVSSIEIRSAEVCSKQVRCVEVCVK